MKSICDLDNFVLSKVFEFLTISELMEVGETNNRLKDAVQSQFYHKYGRKNVIITNISPMQSKIVVTEWGIVVYGLRLALRVIRLFGDVISNLAINFITSLDLQCRILEHYVITYCAEALKHLTLTNLNESSFNAINFPFMNVETLEIQWCILNSSLTNFNTWFPKLKHLRLYSWNIVSDRRTNINITIDSADTIRSLNLNLNTTVAVEHSI